MENELHEVMRALGNGEQAGPNVARAPFYWADSDSDDHAPDNVLYPLTSDEEHAVNQVNDGADMNWFLSDSDGAGDAEDAPPNNAEEVVTDALRFAAAIDTLGGDTADTTRQNARLMSRTGWELRAAVQPLPASDEVSMHNWRVDYPGHAHEDDGPSQAVLENTGSPLWLFFFFLPKQLWRNIAGASNEYHEDNNLHSDGERATKCARRDNETVSADNEPMPIEPHELCTFVGLLIARATSPNREHPSKHWGSAEEEGAISSGNFGKFMLEARFKFIASNLNFRSNDGQQQRARHDSLRKLRPVIEVLRNTFRAGHATPNIMSFDSLVLPSHSEHGPSYIDGKERRQLSHSRIGLLCSAHDSYCIGFDLSLGVKRSGSWRKRGSAAGVRAVSQVFGNERHDPCRLLLIPNPQLVGFMLCFQLYAMGFYTVGDLSPTRVDGCRALPKSLFGDRGTYQVCSSIEFPRLKAVAWTLSAGRTLHFLALGGGTDPDSIARGRRDETRGQIQCPRIAKDYLHYSKSVGNHIALQRFSLQRSIRFTKFYQFLFLGLLDMALVNAYIVHREHCRRQQTTVPTHLGFLKELHIGLCHVKDADFVVQM